MSEEKARPGRQINPPLSYLSSCNAEAEAEEEEGEHDKKVLRYKTIEDKEQAQRIHVKLKSIQTLYYKIYYKRTIKL